MNLLVSRDLFRLGLHIDSLSLKYPDNIEKSAEEAAREDTVPRETATGIQRRFAAQGLQISTRRLAFDSKFLPSSIGYQRFYEGP